MLLKYLAGILAIVLMTGYVLPPAVKLKDLALGAVILIGVVLMLIDLWQSLQSKED